MLHPSPAHPRRVVVVCAVVAALQSLAVGCARPGTVDPAAPAPIAQPIAKQGPLDILFVVDNSMSMLEEQQNLRRTVFDERCPITDLQNVPEPYANPVGATLQDLVQVCGIAQLLAAFRADFHIGVITSDVGVCDERIPSAQDPDGLHDPTPQRGCLQGGLITAADDVADRFASAMQSVGTYGSGFERSMEAARIYLDPQSRRAPGCEDDLDGFLRPDAQLLVVFVSDEDDCSHDDGAYGFTNELADEPSACGEPFEPPFWVTARTCHERPDLLTPVQVTIDAFRDLVDAGRTRDVFVGLVGGVRPDGDGLVVPDGCRRDATGITGDCFESGGQSFSTQPGGTCDPSVTTCCNADAAPRLVELARAVNDDSFIGSVCADDYRSTLLPLFGDVDAAAPDETQPL
jgi:hypothetical protein